MKDGHGVPASAFLDVAIRVSPPIRVREATEEDWPFIRKAWAESFLSGGPAVQGADRDHYFREMPRLFSAIMPTASARIACHPEDDDTRVAFAVFTGSTLHYAYVLRDFRLNGVVPVMLDGLPIKSYSFTTPAGMRRLKPHVRGWSFLPRFTYAQTG